MSSSGEKAFQPMLLYLGLFVAVLAFAAAFLVVLFGLPSAVVEATSPKTTVITGREKMLVSFLVNTAQFLVIVVSASLVVVMLVNLMRRLDRLSDRVQALTRTLEAPPQSPVPADPDAGGGQP